MIPYFSIPSLFGIIHAFGVLVAIGILVGAKVLQMRVRQLGCDPVAAQSMITWALVVGFIVAHLFDVVAYFPRQALDNPLILIDPRHFTISSFGGFIGGLAGILTWAKRSGKPFLPYGDSMAFGLNTGWIFGRLGCFVAHDHPGRKTSFFLAVKYPPEVYNGGPRHNLGLYEALFAAALSVAFWIAFRKRRRPGVYLAAVCLAYAPFRFCLDFLRATDLATADARYFGLTPAQYAAIALFITGLWLTARIWNRPLAADAGPLDPPTDAAPPPVDKKRKKKR